MTKEAGNESTTPPVQPAIPTVQNRDELVRYMDDISARMREGKASMHCMLALDSLLRVPNAETLFDDTLRQEAKTLWLRGKALGLVLNDPPFLFGPPEIEEQLDDGYQVN